MIVFVVSLSQPSSREWHLLYVKCLIVSVVSLTQPSSREWHLLYVKCLCVLSRYLSLAENGICYMLNDCVCCLVISAQ